MRNKISYNRFFSNRYIICAYIIVAVVFYVSMFFGPWYMEDDGEAPNMYQIYVNDTYVGAVRNKQTAHICLQLAKEALAEDTEEITFMDADMRIEGEHVIFGVPTISSTIIENMKELLSQSVQETLQRCYMLKINNYIVALGSVDEVERVLQAAVDVYDGDSNFDVVLKRDTDRAFSVLTAEIVSEDEVEEVIVDRTAAGFTSIEDELFDEESYDEELTFSDFDLGLKSMEFEDKVEITECYLKPEEISNAEEAIQYLTDTQNKDVIYKVKSGDTLGGISVETGIPLEDIIAMNDALENENSTIQIDQELVISIPKPTLIVSYTATEYREEEYDAEIIYIDNDAWYTTKKVTRQNPSTGFRKAVSDITYHNGQVHHTEILKQEVLMEAVPKIVERGTQIPPTYIKPLSGGRNSSGFGYRSFRGGGYHYGIDWATPTGTTIYASSGGTVTRSGWSSSYGYCIYIQHPAGIETRYAHNSKLLVKVGQTVSQGQAIALSGNTGDSSGPHLHFEIRVNGKAVNPKDYIK